MEEIIPFIFFGFGLIIGSFLNVVILRLNTNKTFGGRSACMTCRHALSWYELIPLFSYIFLRGRCRKCKNKISLQYPIVEFLSGMMFYLMFLELEYLFYLDIRWFVYSYAFFVTAFSLLLVISVYDLRHKIIPDPLSFMLGALGFLGLFLFQDLVFYPHFPTIFEFGSGILLALPFYLFWLVSRGRWMGLGDAKLAIGLGWMLGLSVALSGIVIAFWIGAIVGIGLIFVSKKYGLKSELPFAPYMAAGAFIAFILDLHLFG